MKKQRWILLLVTFLALLLLCACAKEESVETTNAGETTEASTEETALVTVTEKITLEDLKEYVIVRPSDTSEDIVTGGIQLRKELIAAFDAELTLKEDLFSETVQSLKIRECEILLGNCNRDETRQFMTGMKYNDYGYAMVGKKLVICGGSDEATLRALDAFMANVVKNQKGDVFFDGADILMVRGSYDIDTLTVQGNDLSQYVIVYPNRNDSAKMLAHTVRDRIAEVSGIILNVCADKENVSEKEILIGTTNRTDCKYTAQALNEGTYLIGADDRFICARGADGMGDYYAAYALIAALLENAQKIHQVTLDAETIAEIPMDESLKAMSFNLWVSSITSDRKESVLQTIMAYMPDTIGVQEASPTWMTYLKGQLKELYDYVGLGRDGGSNGEHSAIFYRKDRFELVKTETKWMSPTPDVVSKFKESSLNRVFTYAILLEKKTNREIMIVNTHLEHTSAEARNLQVAVLMNFLKDYQQYPIVLTGDFNATPESEVYRMVTAQLADSSKVAQKAERHYTFHNYGSSSSYIDYAFVSAQNIAVSHYRVITEKMNGMLPSDHYAVMIDYQVMK